MGHRAHPKFNAPQSQQQIVVNLTSLRQLQTFNDRGAIPVYFDVMKSRRPDISITGRQSKAFSIWETISTYGYVTKPSTNVDVITIRFVQAGSIVYRSRAGNAEGTPACATLVDFEDLREVQTSDGFSAISGTIAVDTLARAEAALTGGNGSVPRLALIADVSMPGIKALYCTMAQIMRRHEQIDAQGDLISPLIQEIVAYQLLSAWPRRAGETISLHREASSRNLRIALDYIDTNLASRLTLAEIAKAADISVRSLQSKFRDEIGQTPLQFIIDQRLRQVHRDLSSARNTELSVADVALGWGFVHMSDFAQRYRRLYGCTPSQTRRDARQG